MDDYFLYLSVRESLNFTEIANLPFFSEKFSPSQLESRWTHILYDESVAKNFVHRLSQIPNEELKVMEQKLEQHLDTMHKSLSSKNISQNTPFTHQQDTIIGTLRGPGVEYHFRSLVTVIGKSTSNTKINTQSHPDPVKNIKNQYQKNRRPIDIYLQPIDLNTHSLEDSQKDLNIDSFATPSNSNDTSITTHDSLSLSQTLNVKIDNHNPTTQSSSVSKNQTEEETKLAIVKFRADGSYILTNIGSNKIIVDLISILPRKKSKLTHGCMIDIEGIRYVFEANINLQNIVRNAISKVKLRLSHKRKRIIQNNNPNLFTIK